ncbi:hypothetical protein Tco_1315920 [Tanacetum coccineum]
MHRVRLGLRKQEKKAKHAIEVFDGATHLSYFGAFAIQEELPAKVNEARVISSDLASSEVTYTSISSHGSQIAWACLGTEFPEYLALSNEEVPWRISLMLIAESPIAFSLGYVCDSDPEEDPKEDSKDGPVDYPADGGDGNNDDSSDDDDEEEASKEEEDDHLAPVDSVVAPVVDHVPSSEETKPFETDESAATPLSPPACHTTAMISIRPEASMPFPSEEEIERLLALPSPPPSLLSPWSSPLPHIPSPPLPPLPSSLHSPPHVPTSLPLPSSPLPPLPASLFIPPLVDRREDTPEAKLPPCKRLCLTALTSRYEVGESLTASLRPAGGHGIDYGFIGTLDAETKRYRNEDGRTIDFRDTWVDLREAARR